MEDTHYGLVYYLDGDIYVAQPDGANPHLIVDSDPGAPCGLSSEAFVSPDGRYIAYRSSWADGCVGTVNIVDASGQPVTSFPGEGWDIAWSPDSTRVATWLELDQTIGVYGLDGVRQATLDGSRMCCGDYDPLWSADGASLLVKEQLIVWELPVDGSTPRMVPDEMRPSLLAWQPMTHAPDRTRVAFVSRGGEFSNHLVIAGPDFADGEVLVERQPGERLETPIWSPTGGHVAFVSRDTSSGSATGIPQTADVRVVEVETGLVNTLHTTAVRRDGLLGVSPNGERILFATSVGDDAGQTIAQQLWSVNVDGSDAQVVVDGTGEGAWVRMPASQPPATPLAANRSFALVYAVDGDLRIAYPDGTNPTVIVEGLEENECRSYVEQGGDNGLVSPDGGYIAYRSSWRDGCVGTVNIIDASGQFVTSFPGEGWNIAWSPDSARIATWLSYADKTIGVYGLDGVRKATLDGSRMCCGDYDPIWSHDGASILVKEAGFGGAVWGLPVDGGTPLEVPANDPRTILGFAWSGGQRESLAYSPDGTRVGFIGPDAAPLYASGRGELIVSAVDGTNRQVLIERDAAHGLDLPIWSPTNEQIAFVDEFVTFRQNTPDAETIDLRIVDVRTGVVRILFTRVRHSLEPLGFSPDGRRILLAAVDDTETVVTLWSVATDGSGAQPVVDGTNVGGWIILPADARAE